ncbi:MAG: LCP family protein [Anaerolineales bacterium]|nr:LCP family protein [Anaerolineales bacterium]
MKSTTSRRRDPPRVRLPLWALVTITVAAAAILVGASYWLFQTAKGMASAWEMTSPEFESSSSSQPNAQVTINNEPAVSESSNVAPIFSADALRPWTGNERVTILLLGIDQRCEEEGPTHTDSMMLLTIDPIGLSAAVLSLPRDLWVDIPDVGVDRINQAFYFGELYELPGGGPALAMETVESLMGVPIHYFVTVNFDAFVEVVDLIGGIEVEVAETIDDPSYPDRCYGYDPFYIEAGTQQLNGENALKYARTRATFGGDVDRAGRQQAVILAVRDKILQLDMMPQLITQSPQLWQTFQSNVRTNLSLDEGLQLALLVQDIPRDSIHTAVIDYNYVYNETTPDGRQVLVPIRDNIRQLRDSLFAPPLVPTPVIENLPALMAEENAKVAVYNGTAVFGLAGATQEYLQAYDVNVVEIGNADAATYSTSQIIDFGNNPNTTKYLTQLMHIPPLNISNGDKPDGDYEVLVIIGNDWRVPSQ